MSSKQMSRIIQSAYGRRYNIDHLQVSSGSQFFLAKLRSAFYVIRHRWVRCSSMLFLIILAAGTIFYYNLLVTTEQDVLAARGKVNTFLQRRNDISINLSKAVIDYAKHERGVFTAVVSLRSALAKGGEKDPELEEMFKQLKQQDAGAVKAGEAITGVTTPASKDLSPLARLLAVAEQYPDLKLSNTFINLMTALTDIEKDLAQERMKYNDAVNIYTTNMAKFPINIFAALFGFKDKPYFEATEEAQKLKPISY